MGVKRFPEKTQDLGVRDGGARRVRPAAPLPSRLPLPLRLALLQSSPSKMWLKLEFPLAGEAGKQENRGRGPREQKAERPTALSLHSQSIY